jgi:hypothetical protein
MSASAARHRKNGGRSAGVGARLAALAIALYLGVPSQPAHATALPTRQTGLAQLGNILTVSVGIPDLFTAEEKQRLMSGFATRVLIRVYLHEQGSSTPLAVAVQRVEIIYDIWDEKFRLRFSRGPGPERELEVATADRAIEDATALESFAVADVSALPRDRKYFLAIRSDLNPLSQELLAELRRWLRQPSGPQRRPGSGGGDSFFGTFVTVFINPQIDDSEHQVRFVSQPFELKPVVK